MTPRRVLVLNAGSTSLKFGMFEVAEDRCELLFAGQVEGQDLESAARAMAPWPAPEIVGHRIVHGGAGVRDHCLIEGGVMADLEAAKALAPLHVPPALAAIRFIEERHPGIPQVACIDTAFHAHMPRVAKTYPLPEGVRAGGVVRYGFHGLSCESIVQQLGDGIPERLIIAHLGGGCSVTAVRAGRSVDTTMGLTPSGGLMMATRAGDLDPGVLFYLMRARGLDADALEDLIDRRSGLLGVGGSADMRVLRGEPHMRLAIEMFVASVAKAIAAMMASLGGADLLVFTGGVGEHDAATREAVGQMLSWAGIGEIRVLPSGEDEEIARHAWRLAKDR